MTDIWKNVNASIPSDTVFWTSCALSGKYAIAYLVSSGIYYSDDYGSTWSLSDLNINLISFIGENFIDFLTGELCISQSNSNALAIISGLMFYSDNGGKNWLPSSSTLNNWQLASIYGSNAIAYTGDDIIYWSNDGGITWTLSDDPMPTLSWRSLSISGSNAVITSNSVVYYSINAGKTWILSTSINALGRGWQSISISGSKAVICGINDMVGATTGICYSNDGGITWFESTGASVLYGWASVSISGSYAIATYLNITGPTNTLYGIYYSSDFGETWTKSMDIPNNILYRSTTISGENALVIYISIKDGEFNGGIYSSANDGEDWNKNDAFKVTHLSWLNISASLKNAIAFLIIGGIYYSLDSGETWSKSVIDYNIPDSLFFNLSGVISISGKYAIIGLTTLFINPIADRGLINSIYYSDDFGQTFTKSDDYPDNRWVSVSISEKNAVAIANDINSNERRIYYSENYGKNWLPSTIDVMTSNTWTSVSISGENAVATSSDDGIYYSEDYGKNWYKSNADIAIFWVSISISGQNAIAVGTITGDTPEINIYYSSDYGVTWNKSFSSQLFLNAVDIYGSNALISSYDGGIYSSNNNGQSWTLSNNNKLLWTSVAVSDNYDLACVVGGGIYKKSRIVSNICFLAGTRILVDQGEIAIEKIIPGYHTIDNNEILAVTKTFTEDTSLICFDKNALAPNYPKRKTIVSIHHLIKYQGQMIPAQAFVGKWGGDKVKKIPYNNEPLYNVLLLNYTTMIANGLTVETLHPNNPVAQDYMKDKNSINPINPNNIIEISAKINPTQS